MKKLILLLIGVIIFSGLAMAADPTPTGKFLPFYWIKGKITDPALMAGRQLYLHGPSFAPDDVIKVNVDPNTGNYRVNAMQLKYFHEKNTLQDPNGIPIFLLSVVRGTDAEIAVTPNLAYGAFSVITPQDINFDQGWVDRDLTLTKDEGPQSGQGMVVAAISVVANGQAPLPGVAASLDDAIQKISDAKGACIWYTVIPGAHNVKCDPAGYKHVTAAPYNSVSPKAIDVLANTIVPVEFFLELAGQVVDDGPVILTIVREVNNIRVKWTFNPAYKLPPETLIDLYVLPGKGEGSFTNNYTLLPNGAYNWTKVLSADMPQGNPVPPSWQITLSDAEILKYLANGNVNEFLAINQAGIDGAVKELYFKALPSDANNWSVIDKLPKVMSVGKVDVGISRVGAIGWNLIAYPFKTRDIKNAFYGNFVPADEVKIYDEDNKIFIGSIKYDANSGSWQSKDFVRGKGYWLYRANTGNPITATMIGEVALQNLDVSLSRKEANGWNFVGVPFPATQTLAQYGPTAAYDSDEFKFRNEGTKIIDKSYKKSLWQDQKVFVSKGYLYYRAIPSDLAWTIKLQ